MERDRPNGIAGKKFIISTHTLTWSVTGKDAKMSWQTGHFNSHAHVERDMTALDVDLSKEYFNSHAHVERDDLGECTFFTKFISTHTLTWSVTRYKKIT